jgi:hypothetical protein
MKTLFSSSNKYVIIYSSNFNDDGNYHVKHRNFTQWVDKYLTNFTLTNFVKNIYPKQSTADFFIYKKNN